MVDLRTVRPKAELNGRKKYAEDDLDYRIKYTCPICGKRIRGYRQEEGCSDCNILYDWGTSKPRVVRAIRWE